MNKRTLGSVSLFLALIMLPVFTVAGLTVENCRISAARSELAGAGELAMNSALTAYDRVLYDVYGLFASSASEEELSAAACDYFLRTVENTGVFDGSDGYTRALANSLFGASGLPSGLFGNLVSMRSEGITVTGVPSSSIANPAVMERQIVEYMKYRGPVELTAGLLTKIGCLKELAGQTKAAEKKIRYGKKLSDVDSVSGKAYLAMKDCLDTLESSVFEGGMSDGAAQAAGRAASLLHLMLCCALLTKKPSEAPDTVSLRKEIQKAVRADLSGSAHGETGSLTTPFEEATALLDSVRGIPGEWNAGGRVVRLAAGPGTVWSGTVPADISEAVSRIRAGAGYLLESEKAAGDLAEEYSRLYRAELLAKEAGQESGYDTRFIVAECEEKLAMLEQIFSSTETVREQIEAAGEAYGFAAVSGLHYTVYSDAALLSVKFGLAAEACEELKNSIDGLKKEADEWKRAVDELSPSEIKSGMESDIRKTASGYSREAAERTVRLLEGDKAVFEAIKEGLASASAAGCDLRVANAASLNFRKTVWDKITEAAAGHAGVNYRDFSDVSSAAEAIEPKGYSGYHPGDTGPFGLELYSEHGLDRNSELYRSLAESQSGKEKAGRDGAEEQLELKEKLVESAKNSGAGTAEEESGPAKLPEMVSSVIGSDIAGVIADLYGGASLITDFGNDGFSGQTDGELCESASSGLGEASGLLSGIAEIGEAALETLLAEEYITGMFSCYGDHISVKNGGTALSLSGADMSSRSCFGAEAEYILCGSDRLKTNLYSVRAMIFAVRFALNTLFVMTDSECRAAAMTAASAIAGWTGFGAPIVQNVILVAWALAESGVDIARLLKGESVPIYKSTDTWTLGIGGLKKALADGIGTAAVGVCEDVFDRISDYAEQKTSEAADRLAGSIEEYADSTLDGMFESVCGTICRPIEDMVYEFCSVSERIGADRVASRLEEILNSADDLPGLAGRCAGAAVEKLLGDREETVRSIVEFCAGSGDAVKTNEAVRDYLFGRDMKGGLLGGLREKISSAVSGYIDEYKNKFKEEAFSLIRKGSDGLSAELGKKISEFASGISGGDEPGAVSSGSGLAAAKSFGLGYEGYLKLFILLSYPAKGDAMLRRAAEMIQIGMNDGSSPGDSPFDITSAHTMFVCDASVRVGTPFLVFAADQAAGVGVRRDGKRRLIYKGAVTY